MLALPAFVLVFPLFFLLAFCIRGTVRVKEIAPKQQRRHIVLGFLKRMTITSLNHF